VGEYFGPDGTPLTMDEWAELFNDRKEDKSPESWWRKHTVTDNGTVSTVWLGLNHAIWPDQAPLIWETMIFGGTYSDSQWRYSSREAAWDAHEEIVRALRKGANPAHASP